VSQANAKQGRSDRVHGEIEGDRQSAGEQVFALVRLIPRGRVMTYGQIASLLGSRLSPRAVGWMLHRCPDDVPWQRVVNASGGFSTDRLPDFPKGLQRAMLEAEGVIIGSAGTVDLEQYRWWPEGVPGGGPSE
jgi:methylated-DNA-protein-cysteine methyltransferase-like protein